MVKRFLKFYITFSTNNTQTTYYDSASPVAKDLLLELKKCMEYGATEDVPGQENSARLPFVWGVLQDVQSECEVNSEVNPRLKSAISEIVSSQILQLGGMMEKWHACTAVFFDRGVLLPALSVSNVVLRVLIHRASYVVTPIQPSKTVSCRGFWRIRPDSHITTTHGL